MARRYPEFVTLCSFFLVSKKKKIVKKIENIYMDFEISVNSFKIKKDRSPGYLWNIFFALC